MDDEKRFGRGRHMACAHKRHEMGKVGGGWSPLEAVPVQMLMLHSTGITQNHGGVHGRKNVTVSTCQRRYQPQ